MLYSETCRTPGTSGPHTNHQITSLNLYFPEFILPIHVVYSVLQLLPSIYTSHLFRYSVLQLITSLNLYFPEFRYSVLQFFPEFTELDRKELHIIIEGQL